MSPFEHERLDTMADLLERYLLDELTPQEHAELQETLRRDPQATKAAHIYFRQAGMMRVVFNERRRFSGAIGEVNPEAFLALFKSLEPQTQIPLVRCDPPASNRRTTWSHPRTLVGAIAAAVAITLTLVLAFNVGQPSQTADNLSQTNENSPTEFTAPARSVATLTATHEARWSQVDLSAGDSLYVGQRLTLTHGFAEITTKRGAIAILEAPATIELLDSDNALRLHTGKLVGICETDASKGFTVQTRTARVVDYGTQFGVEVREDGSTLAAVFTGEVELSERPLADDQSTRNVRLTAGWTSQVSTMGVLQLEPKPTTVYDLRRYARSIDDVIDPGFHYRRAVLSSRPLVYWGFDEGMDITSNLAGNSDWDGKAIGQTDHGKGLFGSALKLTGTIDSMGGYVSAMPLTLAQTQSYTLEAWCWLDRAHFGRVLALAELDEDLGIRPKHQSMIEVLGRDANLNIDKPEHPAVRFLHRYPPSSTSTQGENIFSDRAAPIGQWVHLVAVKDPQEVRVYMNGQRVAQNDTQQPVATDQPMRLYVGVSPIMLRPEVSERPNDFRPFAGLIDEVAIYDTALTENTIKQHFLLGQARTDQ